MAGLGVAAGAFGAHGLAKTLTPDSLDTFETAVRYQMYHAFGLLVVGLALAQWPEASNFFTAAGWAFFIGVCLFSGSLFLLSITGIRWLGAITPIGGVAFVLGWLLLIVGAMKR